MNKAIDNTVYKLLVNDDFINYIINPNLILIEMWSEFFDLHPEMIPFANEAKAILLGENQSQQLSSAEMSSLEKNIFQKCFS